MLLGKQPFFTNSNWEKFKTQCQPLVFFFCFFFLSFLFKFAHICDSLKGLMSNMYNTAASLSMFGIVEVKRR